MVNEQSSERKEAVIAETVARINDSLPFPKSLHVDSETGKVTYFMASGMIDESGGGSVHDVDYYSFQLEDLDDLISKASISETKSANIEVEGCRYTDYVDWPYGRVDGSELHRENIPVMLHLGYKKRDSMDIFVIAENKFDTPPQIGT